MRKLFRGTVLKPVSMFPALLILGALGCDVAIAGGAAFTLTVRGNNFTSNSTVEWNGNALPTTFVSSMELQADVAASDISTTGSATVNLDTQNFNPSNSLPFAIESGAGFALSHVAIQANDMVWDPISQQIYLSVSSSNATNGNTITALNPSNGQLGIAQNAGSGPDQLALSSDGSYLYAGIDGSASVQRFTLPDLGKDISIPLGPGTSMGQYYAMQVEAAPGSPHTIAVVRGVPNESPSEQGGVVIYDDATPRPTSMPGVDSAPYAEIDPIQWGSDLTHLYGENDNSSDLYVLSVDANGVQMADDYKDDRRSCRIVCHQRCDGAGQHAAGRVFFWTNPSGSGPRLYADRLRFNKLFPDQLHHYSQRGWYSRQVDSLGKQWTGFSDE